VIGTRARAPGASGSGGGLLRRSSPSHGVPATNQPTNHEAGEGGRKQWRVWNPGAGAESGRARPAGSRGVFLAPDRRGGDTSGAAGAGGPWRPSPAPGDAWRSSSLHRPGHHWRGIRWRARPAPGAGHVPTPLVSRASYCHSALSCCRGSAAASSLPGDLVALSTVPFFPWPGKFYPILADLLSYLLIYLASWAC
jgi:hypothetical protein